MATDVMAEPVVPMKRSEDDAAGTGNDAASHQDEPALKRVKLDVPSEPSPSLPQPPVDDPRSRNKGVAAIKPE